MRAMLSVFLGLSIFVSPVQATAQNHADTCSEYLGSCQYYQCIEDQVIGCGAGGYAIDFGGYYCNKFSELDFKEPLYKLRARLFPSQGNAWRDQVRSCLQVAMQHFLEDTDTLDCKSLQEFAFASHPECYTDQPSFCDLPPESVLRVGLTLELPELTNPVVIQQMQDTAEICVSQLDNRINLESSWWVTQELNKVRSLWSLVAKDPLKLLEAFKKR